MFLTLKSRGNILSKSIGFSCAERFDMYILKQKSIPLGCVPPALHCTGSGGGGGGGSASRGVCIREGVYIQEGLPPGGGLPLWTDKHL